MNEETIGKVLTGEISVVTMSYADFIELLRCLGHMYFARVLNCVDGTGKSDKEWTALSYIFNRVVESITAKPCGNSAAMRDALVKVKKLFDGRIMFQQAIREAHKAVNAALSAPPRNCDVGTAEEQDERFQKFCNTANGGVCLGCPIVAQADCGIVWAQMPYEEGGAK